MQSIKSSLFIEIWQEQYVKNLYDEKYFKAINFVIIYRN